MPESSESSAAPHAHEARLFRPDRDEEALLDLLRADIRHAGGAWYLNPGEWRWKHLTQADAGALESLHLWFRETRLVGFVWPGKEWWEIVTHPETPDVLEHQITWLEEEAARAAARGSPNQGELLVWVSAINHDAFRRERLKAHGFRLTYGYHSLKRCDLGAPRPPTAAPPGYLLTDLQESRWLESRIQAYLAAFHPSPMTAAIYRAVTASRSYRAELDVVAVSDRGDVGAFSLGWLEAGQSEGFGQSIGVHPRHQGRDLAACVLNGLLDRFQACGAASAWIAPWLPIQSYPTTRSRLDHLYMERLYQLNGFREVCQRRSYFKRVKAGSSPAT